MEVMAPALVVTPHPLTLQGQRVLDTVAAEFAPGDTLAELLARQGVVPDQQWVVTIGGVDVPEHQWSRVRPKHGHLIEARRVAQKDVLRIVAVAALAYFTFGAGGIGGGSFLGLTGGVGQIAAGAAYLAGSAVINKLLAPKQISRGPEPTVSPTYSLNGGGRNRGRAYEPMGLVLGEPYAVPDLAAQPYTYFANGEQYLWQMFHLGLNCADASTLRIGQTALDAYQGVTVLRSGLASGNSDLPALGTSVDTVQGGLLSSGVTVTRTSSAGTVRLAVDLVYSLFATTNDGAFASRSVDVVAEYRLVGSGTWIGFTPGVASVAAVTRTVIDPSPNDRVPERTYEEIVVPAVVGYPAGTIRRSNASQKPLRVTVELAVPSGQYEVRLTKVDADYLGTQGSNAVEWVQFRSFQQDTASYDGQARLAVQIQASGQLNGSLDELNAALRAKPMPYWNGSSWVTATDRASGLCNPGAIFLLLARGIFDTGGRRLAGLGYSDSQIDIAGLQRFMVRCAAAGFEFDLFLQQATSLEELLDAIAYAGMGELAWPDGKIGVTFFTRDDPIEGVINMANIKAKSFEVDYATLPTADEIEFQYFDRNRGNAWKPIRVLAPGVTNPRSTASQQLIGVTGEAHAAMLARFSMAQNIYQRKTVTLEQDLEYMTHRKGSVVAVSHDLTQWGYSGRLLACQDVGGVITLTLDDIAPGENPLGGPSTRYIGLRLPGETQMRAFPVASFSGEARTVTLDAAWPGGVPLPGSTPDNPARDTVWIYDFKPTPGQRMQVASIDPSVNGARISLVPFTDEFWDYVETGVYQPPPNNSLLRGAPEVTRVMISEELARQGNTFYTELSASIESTGPFARAELWGAVGNGEETPPLALLDTSQSQSLKWRGGLDERWHLEIRLYGDTRAGQPYRLYFDVQGLRVPPAPFDVFTVLAQPDGTRQFNFAYTATPAPLDWLGAEIRYLIGTHSMPAWDSMMPLQVERSYYTASPIEVNQLLSGAHTFACRSIDTTGNVSEISYFQITLPPRRLGNVVAEFDDQAEDWPGALSGCTINDALGIIEANSTTTWDSLTSWNAWTRWNLNPVTPISYTSPVRDLTAVLTCLVDVSVTVAGTLTVELRSSSTSNDPVADPSQWTAWGPADLKVDGRYIQVRITVASSGGSPVPLISSLNYVVSAPLLNEYINDIDIASLTGFYRIGAGDVRVPLVNSYGSLLELQVVIQDASAGTWSWQLIDKTLTYGPRVQFKLNGTLADPDLVDFIVKGF
jgi:Putative phage tail protein